MSTAWDTEVHILNAKFDDFKVKRFSDSKIFSFLKRNVLKWAAGVTIGYTVYIDDDYFGNARGAEILKHEAVHVKQWDSWWILQPISYALLLPTVFTLRAVWEWQAYKENLRSAYAQYAGNQQVMDHYCQWVAGLFCGWNYFFMFPFRKFMYKKCQKFVAGL